MRGQDQSLMGRAAERGGRTREVRCTGGGAACSTATQLQSGWNIQPHPQAPWVSQKNKGTPKGSHVQTPRHPSNFCCNSKPSSMKVKYTVFLYIQTFLQNLLSLQKSPNTMTLSHTRLRGELPPQGLHLKAAPVRAPGTRRGSLTAPLPSLNCSTNGKCKENISDPSIRKHVRRIKKQVSNFQTRHNRRLKYFLKTQCFTSRTSTWREK